MIDRLVEWIREALNITEREGTITATVPLYVLGFLIFLIILLSIVVWSLKRRRDPHFSFREHSGFVDLLPSLVGMTHGDLVKGNAIRILENGDFFPPLLKDLENASKSINFETYLWKKGKIADRIIDVMMQKSGEGIAVRLLVDASGSSGIGFQAKRKLTKAGVEVQTYHPWRFGNLGRMNNRDHRKIVVVDGQIAYLGGHCIVDSWLGNAQDKKHFRDISVRVEGPIVNRVQACFSENWIEECGEVLAGEAYFPHLKPAGDVDMQLVYTTAMGSTSALELLHFIAVHAAAKNIWIQNPYFLPDPELMEALIDASQRGVDVRVMLPAAQASDHSIVQHASHHHFGTLLKQGVRIFEYQKTLLHQKVMTVDHIWSCVGSTNIDDRSFELNDEVTVGIVNEAFAAQMEKIFLADLEHARECRFEEWPNRGWMHKLTDGSAYLINEQL